MVIVAQVNMKGFRLATEEGQLGLLHLLQLNYQKGKVTVTGLVKVETKPRTMSSMRSSWLTGVL